MKKIIIFARHSRYDKSLRKGKGGSITEKGKAESREKIIEDLSFIFNADELKNTRFLIVASPTRWKSKSALGARAEETGEIYKNEIIDYLCQNCGMSFEDASACFDEPEMQGQMQLLLQEPNFWTKAPAFIKKLEDRYGGRTEKFWQTIGSVGMEVKNFNENAETSLEVAERMKKAFLMAMNWGEAQSGSNTCVIMVSHGEALQPFYDAMKIEFGKTGYNEGIITEFREGDNIVLMYDLNSVIALSTEDLKNDIGKGLGEE